MGFETNTSKTTGETPKRIIDLLVEISESHKCDNCVVEIYDSKEYLAYKSNIKLILNSCTFLSDDVYLTRNRLLTSMVGKYFLTRQNNEVTKIVVYAVDTNETMAVSMPIEKVA